MSLKADKHIKLCKMIQYLVHISIKKKTVMFKAFFIDTLRLNRTLAAMSTFLFYKII